MGCVSSRRSFHPDPPIRSVKISPPLAAPKPRPLATIRHLATEPLVPSATPTSSVKSDSSLKRREEDHGHNHGTVEVAGISSAAGVVGFGAAAYAFDSGMGGDAGAGGGDVGGDGGGGE
ncbi:hypothetical protein FRC09_018914 [Ceratobasidium sp. 395]|nr:hypothetical protein FRC09_018914 [Ceratobasidium sp. 395]